MEEFYRYMGEKERDPLAAAVVLQQQLVSLLYILRELGADSFTRLMRREGDS